MTGYPPDTLLEYGVICMKGPWETRDRLEQVNAK